MLQFKHEGKEIPFSTKIDQFYVQQGKEINNFLNEFKGNVTEIYADGDELQLILERIKNLPHGVRSSRWRGGLAAFIAENLIV